MTALFTPQLQQKIVGFLRGHPELTGGATPLDYGENKLPGTTDMTGALQAAVDNNKFVMLPPEGLLISEAITVPDGVTVYGRGYSSHIKIDTAQKNVFVSGNNCLFSNFRAEIGTSTNDDLTTQNCVYINSKTNVAVRDCWLDLGSGNASATATNGVQVRDSDDIRILDNIIYGGSWPSGAGAAASAADILLYSGAAGARIRVNGNYCLSDNSQGIYCNALGKDSDLIVTENICVTLDPQTCVEGGAWSEIASGGDRRHGIVVNYNADTTSASTLISENLCKNTLWTGIYCPAATTAAVTISDNICEDNGYTTSNSLSGGIYIHANNGEVKVVGNRVRNYRNTDSGVGGITVNGAVAPDGSCLVSNNTVTDSATHGIALGTFSTNVRVSGNAINRSAEYGIYVAQSAAVTTNGGHRITANEIHMDAGNNSGIYINRQSSEQQYVVKGNIIKGYDNTTDSDDNVGIRLVGAPEWFDVDDNFIDKCFHGIFYDSFLASATRHFDVPCSRNSIKNCEKGIRMNAAANTSTAALEGNRFVSCTTDLDTDGGYLVAYKATKVGDLMEIAQSAAPTVGTWIAGDKVYDTSPSASGFMGWVCTTGGNPGTWKTFGAVSA